MTERVYLDHAGAAIPPADLLQSVAADLQVNIGTMGNPHSSIECSRMLEDARAAVLHHFKASHDYWDVVFTSGATASLRLIGESFPFGDGGSLVYASNSHTSVLGLRAFARSAGVFPSEILAADKDMHITHNNVKNDSENIRENEADQSISTVRRCCDLLVTSAECNFSGVRCDLEAAAGFVCEQNKGQNMNTSSTLEESVNFRRIAPINDHIQWVSGGASYTAASQQPRRMLWTLDAAKLVATSPLDLSEGSRVYQPDFVTISFYKMFGYPTGLGALLIRRSAASLLSPGKRYFGGGTVAAISATELLVKPRGQEDDARSDPHTWLEDGTQHYLGILCLRHGFDAILRRGGICEVGRNALKCCYALVNVMLTLKHNRGQDIECIAMVTLYGWANDIRSALRRRVTAENGHCKDMDDLDISVLEGLYGHWQGPTIAFNVCWADGSPVGFAEVARLAQLHNIQLRTGCFCNIGACQDYLQLSADDIRNNLANGRTCWDDASGSDILGGRPTGAVRVSFGLDSSLQDCKNFISFLKECFLNRNPPSITPNLNLTPNHSEPYEDDIEQTGQDVLAPQSLFLAEICVYPIKSCGAIKAMSWPVGQHGLILDRVWVVADATGRALTLKLCPKLAKIRPSINIAAGVLVLYYACDDNTQVVPAPLSIKIGSYAQSALRSNNASACVYHDQCQNGYYKENACEVNVAANGVSSQSVRVCGQKRQAVPISHDADAWFSSILDIPCKLLCSENSLEQSEYVRENVLIEKEKEQESRPAFANEAALLLVSRESIQHLDDLVGRVTSSSGGSIGNFRANLVVEGAPAHEEDTWDMVGVEGIIMKVTKPCARCSVVNVDGKTGVVDSSTLRTLSTYRRDSGQVYFGQFLAVSSLPCNAVGTLATLRTGLTVTVLHKKQK